MASLSEFATEKLGDFSPGGSLADIDPISTGEVKKNLPPYLTEGEWGNQRIEALLATIFWQIVMASQEYQGVLHELAVRGGPMLQPEVMVTPHGMKTNPRYDLLILDYSDPTLNSRIFKLVNISPADLRDAHLVWRTRRLAELRRLEAERRVSLQGLQAYHALIQAIGPEFAVKALKKKDFCILAAPLPPLEYTSVPPQAWRVSPSPGQMPTSTAGAIVKDARNQVGVTACLHGISGGTGGNCIGRAVQVYGQHGTVWDFDQVSDSCFIDLPYLSTGPFAKKPTAGPLQNVTPRQYETVSFDGLSSGPGVQTTVQSWSPDIPFVQRYNQLKVFTTDVTNQGDSGAALLDVLGNILGFSFYRTGLNAMPAFSAWVWADSVFSALGLTTL